MQRNVNVDGPTSIFQVCKVQFLLLWGPSKSRLHKSAKLSKMGNFAKTHFGKNTHLLAEEDEEDKEDEEGKKDDDNEDVEEYEDSEKDVKEYEEDGEDEMVTDFPLQSNSR